MMNRILTILAIVTIVGQQGYAQAPADLEVRLELLQQTRGDSVKAFSLAVSVINHSGRDIYIPHFKSFIFYSGIHLYEKNAGNWKELSLSTHEYEPITPRHGIDVHISNNPIARSVRPHVKQVQIDQDALLASVPAADKTKDLSDVLFLKKDQELDRCSVYDLDWLGGKHADYKISFANGMEGTALPLSDAVNIRKTVPGHIGHFEVFIPGKILSNTIYLATGEWPIDTGSADDLLLRPMKAKSQP